MKLVKIASGVSASVALLGAGGAASMPQVQVQAAVKYQIRVSKKAYVYTSKGKKTKKSYKKNAKVTAYGIKWIKGKKYYNLGRGRYIRTSNAKKVVHRYSYSTQTKKITRTIKMYQPKGVKKVIQNAYIKRTVKTDNKTKKKTYGVWSTSSWKKYKVAKVSGYTASRSSVGAAKVTYKRKNQTIKITYKVIKKTNKKKKTSKKTDTKHATKPSTTPSKPANSGSSGSTGNSGSSSSSSSSSNNPGKGDAGASNKPSNSGSSSPDSNKPSEKPSEPVKTAPADKVTTKEVPFKTVYQADSSMEAGTKKTVKNGENGIDTTTTKYNVDGSVKSTSTARTKEAVNEVIAVGTKTLVKTENLPYKTVNKDDSTLAKGTTKVVTKGVNGSRTTTTTYSLNTQTGKVTPTSSVKTVDPIDEVIAVGTKKAESSKPSEPVKTAPADKVTTKEVPFKTVYQADSSMEAGTKKTVKNGENGIDTTTTKYNIDGSIKSTSTTHSKKAVDQIVAVGTKQTVKVETISYKTVKKDDSTLAKGTTKVITAGENGSRTTTTTYDLDTETGEVTANEQVTTVDPVDEVIAVGTREANPFNAEKTAELKQRLLAMINDYRAEVGASPLTMLDTYDSILDERAASKAKDLGTTGTWDHSGYDDLPEALTTVSDEELKAHGADDGYVHGGESIGANCFGLYDSTEDQINNYMHYEKMAEDDEKADYQAIVIDKTRDYFTGPSQTCLHYLMMIDKKISKVYMGVGTYVDANGNAWLSAIFEFAL